MLDRVASKNLVKVACRLNAAAARATESNDSTLIEQEIIRMRKEGLFGA